MMSGQNEGELVVAVDEVLAGDKSLTWCVEEAKTKKEFEMKKDFRVYR